MGGSSYTSIECARVNVVEPKLLSYHASSCACRINTHSQRGVCVVFPRTTIVDRSK